MANEGKRIQTRTWLNFEARAKERGRTGRHGEADRSIEPQPEKKGILRAKEKEGFISDDEDDHSIEPRPEKKRVLSRVLDRILGPSAA